VSLGITVSDSRLNRLKHPLQRVGLRRYGARMFVFLGRLSPLARPASLLHCTSDAEQIRLIRRTLNHPRKLQSHQGWQISSKQEI